MSKDDIDVLSFGCLIEPQMVSRIKVSRNGLPWRGAKARPQRPPSFQITVSPRTRILTSEPWRSEWLRKKLTEKPEDKIEYFESFGSSESSGPLSDEEHAEYLDHRLSGLDMAEAAAYQDVCSAAMRLSGHTEPSHERHEEQFLAAARYIHLARRFMEYGTVDSQSFDPGESFNG